MLQNAYICKSYNSLMEPYELVRQAAKAEGLTQNELSKLLSKSQNTISEALNGKNEKTLNKIVNLLVNEYGYERSYFFPSGDQRLTKMEEQLKRMEETLKNILRRLHDSEER